jgi:hypothetical protein
MVRFERNVCPLCDRVMRLRQVAKVNVFDCPTQVDGSKNYNSHYEVAYDKDSAAQKIHLGQWIVENFDDHRRSRLYKKELFGEDWKLIGEIPQIKADLKEIMLTRIKRLAP